jgi:SAM-dependent methyltransferase
MAWSEDDLGALVSAAEVTARRFAQGAVTDAHWDLLFGSHRAWLVPALDALQRAPAGRVLDLGCGRGVFAIAAFLMGRDVVGMDWFTPAPRFAHVEWRRGNVMDGTAWGGRYSAVFLHEVLEHIEWHPHSLFAHARRHLVEGGMFEGSTPAPETWPVNDRPPDVALDAMPEWCGEAKPRRDVHVRLYHPSEVSGMLHRAGLTIMQCGAAVGPYRYSWEAMA